MVFAFLHKKASQLGVDPTRRATRRWTDTEANLGGTVFDEFRRFTPDRCRLQTKRIESLCTSDLDSCSKDDRASVYDRSRLQTKRI